MYSENINKAIIKAAILHQKQTRKTDNKIPYVTHVFAVGCILSRYTRDEDVIIAGILHDTIEDTDYTPQQLEKDFGYRIKNIVLGVTEKKYKNGEELPWNVRKKAYLENLLVVSRKSLLVSAADQIHNMSSLLHDFGERGDGIWESFRASPKEKLWYYGAILHILCERLKNIQIVRDYEDVFSELHDIISTSTYEYKKAR